MAQPGSTMDQPLLSNSSASSPSGTSQASPTSFTFVSDPQIPKLLERIEGFVRDGFRDTRVLDDKPDFTQNVLETPFQLILTHSCLVLGPAGAGKTTLVKALAGEQFQPGVQPGPHLRNRTMKAQSIGVGLEDLSDQLRLEIIDTPGWCPDTSADIHAQYKEVLREKGLPKEHAPHIILFCVPVSMLRQFDQGKAKQMSQQLNKLKFDGRFPIRVLPVATKADTESLSELPDLQAAIKELAEAAFKEAGAIIDDAQWTMFDPNDASRVRGPSELDSWIKATLLEQLRSEEFTGLWRLALAQSVQDHTREHCETLPASDSALRLFNSACRTVAAACGRAPDLEVCKSLTVLPEELPWWTLLWIPKSKEKEWQLPCSAAYWLGFRKRFGPWSVAAFLLVFSLVVLIVSHKSMDQMVDQMTGKYNSANDQLDKMTDKYNSAKDQLDKMTDKYNSATDQLDKMTDKYNSANDRLDQMTGKYNRANDQLDKMTDKLDKITTCSWQKQTSQCSGLVAIGRASSQEECRDVCCRMGEDYCGTWQFRDGYGCWLGHPDSCDGDDGWNGGQL